jgi:hypothetical protein
MTLTACVLRIRERNCLYACVLCDGMVHMCICEKGSSLRS